MPVVSDERRLDRNYEVNFKCDRGNTFLTALETVGTSVYNNSERNNNDDDDDDEAEDNEGSQFDGNSATTPLINNTEEDGNFPKARHIFGLMGFLGFAVVYAMRVNLSVAIVAMVNHTAIPQENSNASLDDTCPIQLPKNNSKHLSEGEFVWDEATQGIVLGSFFYGYVLTQVPGGRLAETVGGKRVYGYGVLLTAIFTLLTPIAAKWNLPMLVLIRVLEGMAEGVTYPAMHAMLAHWIPPLERNKFAAIVYAGSNIGTVISMPLTGWLCSLDFLGGWPSAFYIFGLLGIVWFLFWYCLVYDKPSLHPRISQQECEYIEHNIRGMQPRRFSDECLEDELSANIPWRSILTSVPLWAILITQCGQGWVFYTQLTELPTYMSNILHYDIESNAMLNAVPYLTAWIVGIICSAIADWTLEKRYITLLNSYKLWNTVSSVIPALGLIGVGYVGCDWKWVTFMLAGVSSFVGAAYAGNQMNHIALSPRYAGTMYGITNTAGNICGFMAPYFIGVIINHRETMERWRLVFWSAGILSIVGNLIYLFFASAEEQNWSRFSYRRVASTSTSART